MISCSQHFYRTASLGYSHRQVPPVILCVPIFLRLALSLVVFSFVRGRIHRDQKLSKTRVMESQNRTNWKPITISNKTKFYTFFTKTTANTTFANVSCAFSPSMESNEGDLDVLSEDKCGPNHRACPGHYLSLFPEFRGEPDTYKTEPSLTNRRLRVL